MERDAEHSRPSPLPAKTIVQRAHGGDRWFGVRYNMNIYRGCTHGCIYCDSRSECYRNPDFDTIRPKANALEVIERDLCRLRTPGVVATGSMSDPYNPLEADLALTRGALTLLAKHGFGVAVITKSALIARDIDALSAIRERAPALALITVTTAEDALCRKLEPNVAPTSERFKAIRLLSNACIPCGVMMMPLLPFINDTPGNVLGVLKGAKDSGARYVTASMGLTLRRGNREYFYQQLSGLCPGLAGRYMRTFGERYECDSPDANALRALFSRECKRLGLLYHMHDIIEHSRASVRSMQLSWL